MKIDRIIVKKININSFMVKNKHKIESLCTRCGLTRINRNHKTIIYKR